MVAIPANIKELYTLTNLVINKEESSDILLYIRFSCYLKNRMQKNLVPS